MNLQTIKETLFARPWRRAVLHTSSGEAYAVPTRDHIFFSPIEPLIIIQPAVHQIRILDADAVTGIDLEPGRSPRTAR